MIPATATHAPIAGYLWSAETRNQRLMREILLIVGGSLFLALSARIQVPFWPVPVTMQTFAMLLVGAAFGWKRGGATIALYLFEGGMGLPFFASGAGWAYFMGPTGGYLVGFLFGGMLVGWLAERGFDRGPVRMMAAMLAGHAVIFAFGLAWLGQHTGYGAALWTSGFTPFIVGTFLKSGLGAALMPAAWSLAKRKDA